MSSIDRAGGAGFRDFQPAPGGDAPAEAAHAAPAGAAPVRGGPPAPVRGAPAPAAAPAKPMVMCPVLGAMIREGRLTPDASGDVDLGQLKETLRTRGNLDLGPAGALTGLAPWVSNRPEDSLRNVLGSSFNPLHFKGGMIDHFADSAILKQGRFDEERFDELASYAHDLKRDAQGRAVGGRLTVADCGRFAASAAARDGKVSGYVQGVPTEILELSAVITIFGSIDPVTRERSIDVAALRDLYQNQKLPPESAMRGRPQVGFADLNLTMAKMTAALPLGGPTGIVTQGVKTALGEASDILHGRPSEAAALAQNALMGIGKAICPHMNGTSKMPSLPRVEDLASLVF